ncbi:hypothetical protein EJP67_10580 [Variovorax guangxiensis]|uniref:Haemolysin-type calcium binding-related domain-containing protein n=5 Tax=Burkholderiales TaxID=80840 RepID=A0A3S1A2M5_9BURK|nr:hypothetical protein EJP67_10580 [Variovorax guangxiensis]
MWTIYLHGGDGNDTLRVRNSDNNYLIGDAGDDILDGAAGWDYLKGGTGNDTFLFGRGSGSDVIQQDGDAQGETDTVLFGPGVAADQLWFRQNGDSLEISIIGTSNKITMKATEVEQFKTSDGKTLLDSQVHNLVQAMAAFSPPAAGQTTLPVNYQSSLNTVIAANWQ